jgi:hypothetical protein
MNIPVWMILHTDVLDTPWMSPISDKNLLSPNSEELPKPAILFDKLTIYYNYNCIIIKT